MDIIRHILKFLMRHALIAGLTFILLIVAAVAWNVIKKRGDSVASAQVVRGPAIAAVYGIGTITASHVYQLKLGLIGTIDRTYVKEGDEVVAGQKMIIIERVTFRAPFTGVVTAAPFNVGENAPAQISILTLVDRRDPFLLVSLDQRGALAVHRGQTARISFDTIRDQTFSGTVGAVYANEGNFFARVETGNLPPEVLPGMTADVAIVLAEHPDALLVPFAAVEGGNTVWRSRAGSLPVAVDVKLGFVDRNNVEINGGDVVVGDRVLIRRQPTP